jgi:TonB family protein
MQDALGRRLGWAILASLVGNLLLWRGVAAIARRPVHFDPRPVEITRVILQPDGKRIEKVIKKEHIAKKIAQVPKEIPKPLPVVHRERPHIVAPAPHREPQSARHDTPTPPKPQPLPQPETAHNRLLTAPDNKTAPAPTDHVVQAGGNADVGKPVSQQGAGNAKTSPDVVVKKDVPKSPEPIKQPAPPKPPALPSGNDKKDVPAPDPPKPELPKPDPPKKKGPTREAEPADQTKPDIPDELKHSDFKSFVRVAVDIDADGSFTVTLRTSSGNQEVDNRVLEALKKWKWKPALRSGEPYKSTQRFKFEFEVQ